MLPPEGSAESPGYFVSGAADAASNCWHSSERRYVVKVYFCEPQSPGQHGTNENTDLLLRQCFRGAPTCLPIRQRSLIELRDA
jgi:IS30 family transposase